MSHRSFNSAEGGKKMYGWWCFFLSVKFSDFRLPLLAGGYKLKICTFLKNGSKKSFCQKLTQSFHSSNFDYHCQLFFDKLRRFAFLSRQTFFGPLLGIYKKGIFYLTFWITSFIICRQSLVKIIAAESCSPDMPRLGGVGLVSGMTGRLGLEWVGAWLVHGW